MCFSQASWAYSEESDAYPPRSVEEAKALLEEAGEPNGFSFTLKLDPSPTTDFHAELVYRRTIRQRKDVRRLDRGARRVDERLRDLENPEIRASDQD